MKKVLIAVVGVLVLLALIWAGIKFFGKSETEDAAGTDVSSGDVAVPATADIDSQSLEEDDPEAPDSGEEVQETVSGSDVSAQEDVEAPEDGTEDILEEELPFSEEDVLYSINTSAGSNLGMVPIVNGNAVVLMDGGSGTTYQGEYVPEEQSAYQFKLEEATALASSEGKIGAGAFYRESMMESFEFPEGVASIEKFAFARSGLQSITIPEGVTSIGYGAFYHCDSLTDVAIPESVTAIEENAFAHTPWLENWMAAGAQTADPEESADAGDFLIVGDGILLAYRGSAEDPELPAEVKSVVPGVFGE